ncbi:uncharacterized protein EAF01_000009 [Botrytis porri]|uniref:uncharacterized protein n=1 Tax=Botrytis porri TaxID=87229 RepID=UPI0018FF1CE9|nr:uncharacterized protein EAF01_000009 [Botrytis porri]KAF7913603.1 hypothetical protein EAF01_000009 [Botrytis porri]
MEAAGYIIRAISSKHDTENPIYVAQTALIVLSPVLMAAACYTIFVRENTLPRRSEGARTTKLFWIPPRFITPIFVMCDFPLVGVAIQMACFGLFSIIAIRFNFTSRRFVSEFQQRITLPMDSESKNEKDKFVIIDEAEKELNPNWQTLLQVVTITCVLILIKNVFRMGDFALGRTGYTEEHEWW